MTRVTGYVGRAILSSLVAYTILLIIAISLVTITEMIADYFPNSFVL
ncbi:MAG: hypothetical protein WCC17_25420 [Candidatus Nitrosopolaris sp.]